MKVTFQNGRIMDLDDAFYINPTERCDDIWALSVPFSNFSITYIIRAKEHDVVSVLLDSRFGGRIKVSADDLATSTDDFLLEKGYTKEQIAELKKDADNFNSVTSAYSDDESLFSYFENECDYAYDGDINTWYHSDLLMRDCLERVTISEYEGEVCEG